MDGKAEAYTYIRLIGRINIYFSVQSLLKLRVPADFCLVFFFVTRALTNYYYYILLVFPSEIGFAGPCGYEPLHAATSPYYWNLFFAEPRKRQPDADAGPGAPPGL